MATKKSAKNTPTETSQKESLSSTTQKKETKSVQKDPYVKPENDNWVYLMKVHDKFKMYSQTGEEGIIGYILAHISANKFLVDLGAWDGQHLSNTKYFLDHQGYEGLLIDGDNHGNENVKQHFITKENICGLLKNYGCPKYFDFLNIDLDGNDYYILNEILSQYRPALICAEFNGTIDNGVSKTIAYNEHHTWGNDDYYGFSFEAGKKLAEANGYAVVFQNDSLNIYMVRKDLLNGSEFGVNYAVNKYHPHNPNGEWVEIA